MTRAADDALRHARDGRGDDAIVTVSSGASPSGRVHLGNLRELLLLSDGRRAPDRLHYTYGALALGLALSPWFYAPRTGQRRLLWFSVTTLVAGALAVRALMTGS